MGSNNFLYLFFRSIKIFLVVLFFLGIASISVNSKAQGHYSNEGEGPVEYKSVPVFSTMPFFMQEILEESMGRVDELLGKFIGQFYPTNQEMLLGTPTLGNLISGHMQRITEPAYWSNYFTEALVNGVFVIPKPIDVVKPEIILPTEEIKEGDESLTLPRREIDLSEVTYEWQGREKTIEEFVITTPTDCLVVLHDGELVYEDYADGWNPDMRGQPWSVTKSFTSALVGIAWEEGKIHSVHDPIEKYIPELENTDWEGATIENLLQMESGTYWDEDLPVLAFNCQVQQWTGLFLDYLTDSLLGASRNEYLKSMERVADPGEEFRYNSGDTQVLAWLVESVYDDSYAEVMSEKLWKPAGMEGNARVIADREGGAIASQGLYAKPYDLARFGEIYRNNGKTPEGKQIISEEWVKKSIDFTEASDGDYGYQWWSSETIEDLFEASGFQGNKVSISPENNLTAVRLSHHLGANLRPNGDNPFKLDTYGFEVEMGGDEWEQAYAAIAEELEAE